METTMSTTTALRSARTTRPRLTARGLLGFLAAVNDRARVRHQLTTMDDHILRDIGVTRADVLGEVRKPLW
jgi:uncharacterized protein YjiS (DUF1127 family)